MKGLGRGCAIICPGPWAILNERIPHACPFLFRESNRAKLDDPKERHQGDAWYDDLCVDAGLTYVTIIQFAALLSSFICRVIFEKLATHSANTMAIAEETFWFEALETVKINTGEALPFLARLPDDILTRKYLVFPFCRK